MRSVWYVPHSRHVTHHDPDEEQNTHVVGTDVPEPKLIIVGWITPHAELAAEQLTHREQLA